MDYSDRQRYWNKVDIRGEDECWPWTGCLDTCGYGQIKLYSENYSCHRIGYYLKNDNEIRNDLEVKHSCDNPCCQNPKHLSQGTHLENMQEAVARGRYTILTNELHSRTKKSNSEILEIREKYATGKYSHRQLAKDHNLSRGYISKIVNKQFRKNI